MNHAWTKLLPSFILTRLDGRLTLQKTIANTGWLFADSILRMGIGMFVGVWIARYLGPKQFGVLSYATAFVALFSAVATLGLDSIVIREVLREPASADEVMGSAFMLKFTGGAVAVVLTVLVISMLHPENSLMHWMVGIIAAGMVFQAFDTIDLWFQSRIQSRYTVYAKSIAFILANMGKVVLVLIHASLIAFAWIGLVEVVIGAAGMVIAYKINEMGWEFFAGKGAFKG
jgi:PST family polysaccharide transporter